MRPLSVPSRVILVVLALVALLAVLRYRPWQAHGPASGTAPEARERLLVGFLPVT